MGLTYLYTQANTLVTVAPLSDKTTHSALGISGARELAVRQRITLSNEQAAMMLIPNGEKHLSAYTWMKDIFKLIGDVQPNKEEIHLEAMGACALRLKWLRLTFVLR